MDEDFREVYGNSQLFHKLITISQEIAPYWKIKGDLKSELDSIHFLASAAERVQQRDNTRYVRYWLRRLKKVAYAADDLFDDFSYELMRRGFEKDNLLLKVKDLFSSSNRLVFRTKMGNRVKDLSKRLKVLLDDNLLRDYFTESDKQTRATLNVGDDYDKIIGRETDISNIVDLLITPPSSLSNNSAEREKLSAVHIGGMAGLGKTKLARTVYNDESVIKHFELRIWVTVPAVFDLEKVLKRIISNVKTNDIKRDYRSYVLKTNDLTMILREMLNGKKYLLVLDDFWDVENFYIWETLISRLKFGSHGSKILITSRKINVSRSIQWMTTTYHLQELSTDECWSIIKEKAVSSSPWSRTLKMVEIAMDLARKCCGLPLAARTLASILAPKKKESEWDFIQKCFEARNKYSEFHMQIYPALKLSYDHLPSSTLKQCFAYCSIFPKGYEIDREEIIQLWMAEGFLVPSSRQRDQMEISMEDIGNEYFDRLLSDSLFQIVEHKGDELDEIQKCKLNDFVYHLARTVAGDEDEYVPRMFPKVGNDKHRLRTFFATEVGDCDKIQKVFRNRNLRVLYLSGSTIQKVPASLSKLRHLRYLNLSGCQNLDILEDQSVNNLYNMQTLVLRNCTSLSKLPEGIGSMKSLRHLDISNTKIKVLPTSVTTLQNLRTLNVSNCPDFEELPENIGSLKDLRSLDISHTKVTKLPDSTRDLEKLEKLRLHSCPNLKDFPNGFEGLVLPEVLNLREIL